MEIFSKNGKFIPLRHGMKIYAGSMVKEGAEFRVIERDSIYMVKTSYNGLTQSKDVETFLKEIA